MKRFPLVTYIEDAGERPDDFNLETHWLGQARDFGDKRDVLLELDNLHMRFVTRHAFLERNRLYLDAVKNVSFEIRTGEVFGLVGESGSGKSTVARMITGIYKPTGGTIRFADTDLTAITSRREAAPWRRQMQMIFQDPFSSLNSRMRVMDIIAEPIHFHRLAANKREAEEIVIDLLDVVGLGAAAARKFPHEFSGGQRQRISIARALATRPRFPHLR